MSDDGLSIEARLNRETDSVTITIRDIPLEGLGDLLRDMGTDCFRNNILDGVMLQYVAGPSLGIPVTKRSFRIGDDEEENDE